MAKGIRQTRTGSFELTVRHKDLPSGRKFFQFPDEASAIEWRDAWDKMVKAGTPIPPELLEPGRRSSTLTGVIKHWLDTGNVSKSDQETLALLKQEVGTVERSAISYGWCEAWVRRMKVDQNLAPSTIRKRVGALSRALDAQIRSMPHMTGVTNPLRSLPDGYSHYGDRDVELVTAVGKDAKVDQSRDRRLAPGEQELMEAALSGIRRPDRERPLELPEGDFMRLLFLFIVFTGARLQEAYMVLWENVDLHKKLIKLRTSKQRRGKVVYRLVPIRQELYPLLKAIKKPKGLVFPFWKGTEEDVKRCSGRLSHRFTDAYSYAGLEDITEHDLRHEATCRWFELKDSKGSWLLRSEEIHRLMGWSAGSTMAAKYASFRGEDLAARLWAAPA